MDDVTQLGSSAVPTRGREIFDAEILDDATAPRQEVRCIRPGVNRSAATDPMRWMPYVTEDGIYYPKRGDKATAGYPLDGPARILEWEPASDAVPDVLT